MSTSELTAEQKELLRKVYRQKRAALNPEQRQEAEAGICRQLTELIGAYGFSRLASYQAFGSEASLEQFHQHSSASLCFPRVEGDHLTFYQTTGPDDFEKSSWGIFEPKANDALWVDLSDIDAMLVPGLVFDRRCQRMGYGRGFYDRALHLWQGISIGVAFSTQIHHENLMTENHDLPMNYLVTEDYILRPLIH